MGTSNDWRITWAVDHIQRHLAEPLTVPQLANRVNLSPSRFRDLFSAQTGIGPVEYLQRLRLRRARLLIERTFLTVKEVMALVGYNDPSHFSRDFRRYHGVTPSSLRGKELATALPRDGNDPSVASPTVRRIRQRRPREPGFIYA
jgi:AraC family transcriptional regulator, arabinose operon regulatory protein